MNKILIFTKNDIRELFNKIRNIVDAKECRLMKSEAQIITNSDNIIIIRKLDMSARGYKANIILYDGNFRYQCINTKTNEVVFEGKGKSYDCLDEIIILNKVGEIK